MHSIATWYDYLPHGIMAKDREHYFNRPLPKLLQNENCWLLISLFRLLDACVRQSRLGRNFSLFLVSFWRWFVRNRMPIGHTHAPTSWMSNRLFLLFLFSFQLECARKLASHVITYSSIIADPDAWVNVLLFLLLLLAESIAFGHGCIEPMLERCSDFFPSAICFLAQSEWLRGRLFFFFHFHVFCTSALSLSTSTVTAHATKCSYMVFVVRFSLLYSINELYAPKTLCLVLFFFSFVIWPFCAEVCVCCRRQKFMYSFGCSLRRSYIIVHLICADVCVRVNARAAQCIVQNCLTKIRCNNKALLFFSSPNAECMACRNMQFGSAFLLLPQKMVIKLWCCSRRASISCFHYFVGPSPSRSHTLGLICCLAYGAARIRLKNSGAQCYWSEQLLTWNHYAQN